MGFSKAEQAASDTRQRQLHTDAKLEGEEGLAAQTRNCFSASCSWRPNHRGTVSAQSEADTAESA